MLLLRGLGINEGHGSGFPALGHPCRAQAKSFGHSWQGPRRKKKKNMTPLPDTAPLLFFFFRLFFLAASSAVLEAPSSRSSGSRSPFRWLPKDAASSAPAILPERERERRSESEWRGPAPSSPTAASDAGSRSRWSGRGGRWDGGGLPPHAAAAPAPSSVPQPRASPVRIFRDCEGVFTAQCP